METGQKNRYFIIFLATILLFFSFIELKDMSFDILPEFQEKTIQVQTEALGLAASEVESLVTINAEEMLTNTPWMEKMESNSVNGLSSVNLTFKPDTDIMEARQMVSENLVLSQQIPNVSQESIILQPLSTANRAMAIGLTSENLSLIDISELSRWNIKPALMSVPGVANVSIWGHRERQMQVQVDQEKIRYTGISLEDIISTTGNSFWMSNLTFLEASTPGSGGWVDTPNQRLEIQHILPIRDENDLSRVTFPDKNYLTLGDVANVVEGHQPLIGDAILDDGKGILLVVEKYPWSNLLEVTNGVEAKLKDLQVGLSDIEVDTAVFRPATFIESMLDNLINIIVLSSVLLLTGLIVFISKFRVAVFAFLSITLSLITTLFILNFFGNTFNTILIIGIIASVAIIIDQVVNGFEKSNRGTVQSALITILLVFPVFFLDNEIGLFYQPMALSFVVSVVSGMFFALVVFPSLVKTFSSEIKIENRNISMFRSLKKLYSNILTKIIRRPMKHCLFMVIILIIGSTTWLAYEDYDVTPEYKELTLMIDLENVPGTSLPEMNRVVSQISDDLQSIAGVDNFGSHIGRAVTGDQIKNINSAQIWVSIDSEADYEIVKEKINESLNNYPEIVDSVRTYSEEIIDRHLSNTEEEIFVRVYGPDFDILEEQAQEVKRSISRVDGVISPIVNKKTFTEVPGIQIEVDSEKAGIYGLKPGDIRRAAATLVNGIEVANRFEEQKVYQVAVWSIPEERRNIDDVKKILIDTPNGGSVRLEDVAKVNIVPMMSSIEREGMSRYLDVTFEIRGDKNDIIKNLEKELGDMEFAMEYHAAVKSNIEENKGILVVILTVLIGILLLLQSVFNSWKLAILNFVIIPISLIGGLLSVYIFDLGILSLGSIVGLIIVIAISYRNSIASISHFQDLKNEGINNVDLVLLGSREHFDLIILNVFLTLLIFIPLLLMGKTLGFELGYSMSVVIIGGIISSALLNVFVLPKLYLWACNKNNYES